ncbi:hypothetical protein D3C74_462370 [compost metagenome]
MLEVITRLVDTLDVRDENGALSILEELSKQNKEIKLGKTYWVSEVLLHFIQTRTIELILPGTYMKPKKNAIRFVN